MTPNAARREQQDLYARQRHGLEVERARIGADVFLSPFDILCTGEGTELSYCTWPEHVRSSLPRAECIAFTGKRADTRWFMIVRWDAAIAICGSLLERIPCVDPARYANVGWPDAEQVRRLGEAAILRR